MLFLLWGASGAGKTTCLHALAEELPTLAAHDFDEVGVPPSPDTAWRHRTAEQWVRRALAYQGQGRDMLLSAQLAHGELLACPSASALTGITSCLLDCDDYERIDRIRRRGGGTDAATQDMLCWAVWLRMHARDPQWHPEAITESGDPAMCWERWQTWSRGDPRWRVRRLDTSGVRVEETVATVRAWVMRTQRNANE